MGNMVTNVCVKSNYDWLQIDKALRNYKSDNNKNSNNNVRSAWGPFPGTKNVKAIRKISAYGKLNNRLRSSVPIRGCVTARLLFSVRLEIYK